MTTTEITDTQKHKVFPPSTNTQSFTVSSSISSASVITVIGGNGDGGGNGASSGGAGGLYQTSLNSFIANDIYYW